MLVTEKPKAIRRVRHYFTLTPDCISKLEIAALGHRMSTGTRKMRPSHIVEMLIETDAIAVGTNAIASHTEEIERASVDKWEGVTLHGQHKIRYGLSLKSELYRILRDRAALVKTSASEVIEWTIREDGITKMNQKLGEKNE